MLGAGCRRGSRTCWQRSGASGSRCRFWCRGWSLFSSVKSWELSSRTKWRAVLGQAQLSLPSLHSPLSLRRSASTGSYFCRERSSWRKRRARGKPQWTPGALVCNVAMLCLLTSSSSCIALRWIPPMDDARCGVFFVLCVGFVGGAPF